MEIHNIRDRLSQAQHLLAEVEALAAVNAKCDDGRCVEWSVLVGVVMAAKEATQASELVLESISAFKTMRQAAERSEAIVARNVRKFGTGNTSDG